MSARRVRRAGRVALMLVLVAPMVVSMPPRSDAFTRLPLSAPRDMVVDHAHRQIFITGWEDDSIILVANYGSEIVKRIPNMPGAKFMELAGDRLYVSLPELGQIHEFDTASLERVNTFEPGEAIDPEHVAKVGNYLWFNYDCNEGRIGSIDLSTGLMQTSDGPVGFPECLGLSGVPGSDSQLVTYSTEAESPSDAIRFFDVLAGRVIRERGHVFGGGDVIFDASGETFVTCLQRRVQRYQTSDLAPLEKTDALCYAGLDMSPDGTTIATAAGAAAQVVSPGAPKSVWRGDDISVMPRNLRMTPDGKRFFAATYYSKTTQPTYNLNTFVPTRPVVATKAFEYQPSGNGDYLAWSQRKGVNARVSSVYAKRAGGRRVKVNAKGTEAFGGGIDGSLVVYQQTRRGQSDIFLYDMATRKRRSAGRRINTRAWEYLPSVSKPWVLFARVTRDLTDRRMLLGNLRTDRVITIDRMRNRNPYMAPGQVNGRYATWVKCTSRCDIFRYDMVAKKTIRLPNPKIEDSFGPGVTPDGTVYFGRGVGGCGRNIRLMKYHDGKLSVMMDLPPGRDFFAPFAYERDGRIALYIDLLTCPDPFGRKLKSDVLSIDHT
jgi:hypothetical protein